MEIRFSLRFSILHDHRFQQDLYIVWMYWNMQGKCAVWIVLSILHVVTRVNLHHCIVVCTQNDNPVVSATQAELFCTDQEKLVQFVPSNKCIPCCQALYSPHDKRTSTLYGDNFSGMKEQQIHWVASASKVLQQPLEAQSWPLLGEVCLLLWLMCEVLPLQNQSYSMPAVATSFPSTAAASHLTAFGSS